jgi:putative FmdB family regulatory protein
MPTYEYVCEKCGHQFEKLQPISDAPLTACPKELCGRKRWGKGRVKRVISAGGGLIFKGSGFYATDYRSEKYKEAAKKDVPPSTSSGAAEKPASGGDSKAAPAKPSSKPAKAPAQKD